MSEKNELNNKELNKVSGGNDVGGSIVDKHDEVSLPTDINTNSNSQDGGNFYGPAE